MTTVAVIRETLVGLGVSRVDASSITGKQNLIDKMKALKEYE